MGNGGIDLSMKNGEATGGDTDGGYGGMSTSKGSDPFVDRSKVRILLCDNDTKSGELVLELLSKCSYQVTFVRSARQVIDALIAEGVDIDIILTEVDLPIKKGMKMLRYITRDKELQRIPVIMMSAQDEVSIVVKCLRLGAADYLVKPLRTNELLNLWTHMWRRRRMLGLAEKNILNFDLDVMASDPSDANTNSSTFFSDDTDDKSRKSINTEMSMPTLLENENNNATRDATLAYPSDKWHDVHEISDQQTGQFSSCPKKSELKIGGSSAFFTYVKSSMLKNISQGATAADESASQSLRAEEISKVSEEPLDNDILRHENRESWENNSQGDEFPSSTSIPVSTSMERSCTPVSFDLLQSKSSDEGLSQVQMHPINGTQFDVAGFAAHAAYPYYMLGAMNQVMLPSSSAHVYQKKLQDLQSQTTSMMPHYNHLPHCPSHVSGVSSFPYYPVGLCVQPGQVPTTHHQWTSFGSSTSSETKLSKVDRREAALIKFRQKRKERCFDKKIRYANRKKLAERRPRVRGQFVRKINGDTVDLNGEPCSAELEEVDEEEEDDDDPAFRDSSPDGDAS
ncbi:hypothetical protein Nepgr_003205 [Nepenthes gracilis]|uniref:Two-component response regulator-like APRR1 n=1 Tax=Nepenthes gracilis TaxID=150966 RepID=A0AAD3XDI5_NEPGR|nr:hypothetical protein Nepgr_003205 [Nepenthes gracilis]